MDDLELSFSMLGEASTINITRDKNREWNWDEINEQHS